MSDDRENEEMNMKVNKSVKKRSITYRVLVFRVESVNNSCRRRDSCRRGDILKASLFIKIREGIEERKIKEREVR